MPIHRRASHNKRAHDSGIIPSKCLASCLLSENQPIISPKYQNTKRSSKDGRRSQPQEVMAPGAHEQPKASVGRGEESPRRAQAYRADDEGAQGRTSDSGSAGNARSSRGPQEAG